MTPDAMYKSARALAASGSSADALQLLRLAADDGHVGAVYALGNWYLHGIGVRKNYRKAFTHFRKGRPRWPHPCVV